MRLLPPDHIAVVNVRPAYDASLAAGVSVGELQAIGLAADVLADPDGVTTIHVETARDMLATVETALPADVFIAVAAVADWVRRWLEREEVCCGR